MLSLCMPWDVALVKPFLDNASPPLHLDVFCVCISIDCALYMSPYRLVDRFMVLYFCWGFTMIGNAGNIVEIRREKENRWVVDASKNFCVG